MKNINWKVSVFNPATNELLGEPKTFRNIEDIATEYNVLSLPTWRNISIGRSNIYNKFIKVEKVFNKPKEEKEVKEEEVSN